MSENLLLTPGPTHIPPELCEALGRPIIHHRTPQFQDSIKNVIEGLQYVLHTKNEIYLLASSGTGAMEAAVCNLLSSGDKAITVQGGKFGERWAELCQTYGVDAKVINVEWGKAVDPAQIKTLLDENNDVKAVFITLCETSTGVVTDVKAVADVLKGTDAVLVVDGVSGVGVTPLQMDEWGVDVVCTASHKGFMMPPGLAFIAMSDKAYALVEKSTTPRYYFDLRKSKATFAKTDTPFTPAINIVTAIEESFKIIKEKGIDNLFAHYAKLARGTRAAAEALGLKLLAEESCISNVLTPILLPDDIDGGKLVKEMRDNRGVTIAGGQGHLKGKLIRIAHMGCVVEKDIIKAITILEDVLGEMGYKFEKGAGVAAAEKIFNED